MWEYSQKTGKLSYDGKPHAVGYSGYGEYKNSPENENLVGFGPIPKGRYRIGEAFTHPSKGPICMRLIPSKETQMYGRKGFMIHGDSKKHAGMASEGCIILDRNTRIDLSISQDRNLIVTA